jgi:hypothetical protein
LFGEPLFALIKPVVDQLDQTVERGLIVFTFGVQVDVSAFSCSQHHYGHDAFAVDHTVGGTTDSDLAGEFSCDTDEFGGRTRVQAQLVDDSDLTSGHRDEDPFS